MTRTLLARLTGVMAAAFLLAWAAGASAQTGMLRGVVTDAEGKPVEGATITIAQKGMKNVREVKTNRKGEWVQIGLFPAEYTVTAEKDGMTFVADIRVSIGENPLIEMQLRKAGPSKEDQERAANMQKLFDEGVQLSRGGSFDESVAKFNEVIAMAPNCHDCYYNIGYAHVQKKEWDKAEAAYQKAVEIKPDYAEAWNGLANVYNAQGKLDEALAASGKAAEAGGGAAGASGAGANALYNQGVILWNQNKFAEARDKFDAATKADPKYGEAWYMLGSANTNVGSFPEAIAAYEEYLKIDPNGSHAAEAKERIDQLKPLVKQ